MSGIQVNNMLVNLVMAELQMLEQLAPNLDWSGLEGVLAQQYPQVMNAPGWTDIPGGPVEENHWWYQPEIRPDLEISDAGKAEMEAEQSENPVKNHDLQGADLDLGTGHTTKLVAIQDNAAIDTDMAILEGQEILEKFMKDQESDYGPDDFVADGYYTSDGDYVARPKGVVQAERRAAHDKNVLDNNGDGILSAEEMNDGLQNSTYGGGRRRLMVWTDLNNDGKIQANELSKADNLGDAIPGHTRKLEIARNGQSAYGNKDVHARSVRQGDKWGAIANGDYALEMSEFDQHALQGKLTNKDYDLNGDGVVTDLERKSVDLQAAGLRRKLDKNHDNKVTVDELEAAGYKMRVGDQEMSISEFRAKYGDQVQLDPDSFTFDISQLAQSDTNTTAEQLLADVEKLHQAMDGWGTDEEALCNILLNRTPDEIELIKAFYQDKYGSKLEDEVADETSGSLKSSLLQALKGQAKASTPGFDANKDAGDLYEAMDGWGTDEDAIFNILSNRTHDEIQAIKDAYRNKYGGSLYDELDSELSGDDWDLAKKLVA